MQKTFKIYRFDPSLESEPHYASYQVETKESERILDCLNRIRWEQDDSLAYRSSCAHGVCGSDAIKINGRCGLACQILVGEVEGDEITLEPLPTFEVIKDLIVDVSPFLERVRQMKPYLQTLEAAPEAERLQDPADSKKLAEAIRCIMCASCVGACPISNQNPDFLGPAPLVWAFRLIFDSRDQKTKERLEAINNPNGAWGCQNHFKCTEVCPKEIRVTKHINELKKEIEKQLSQKKA